MISKSARAKKVGEEGERLAAEHLMEKGYEILRRRYKFRNGEMDIVAWHGDVLVFVEVKTVDLTEREETAFGEPESWLTPRKQAFLRACANHYLGHEQIQDVDCRFDLVTVRLRMEGPEIRHIENAFWM